MKFLFSIFCGAILFFPTQQTFSQSKSKKNLVYVDRKGVLRYTKNDKEASFFGVNYTVPFAYSYRAHKALNVDIEKAMQQDVNQMARLGLDAFRVHVWDTEISDTAGNLLENEHLRLFDFLLAELKKRNIKIVITPIAFWGNGYPERDEATPGFSRKYGKGRATINDTAIVAQENYIKQFFKHINPYTKLTYVDDPDVIAVELNNEPSHSGSKQSVTNYINRLVAAMKSNGWKKPLYYNIAQNPFYADAVAKANIDGVSFQWYPTGLVANHEVEGNFLPNVDHYIIPFDTIPEYRNKSKMVYEFDAADVLQSCMYPAMARSFREAGFQWATQFAYDPTSLAYANTEYQTHYLNLLYTPSKAISLLIASKVFHKLPRLKTYGSYPVDSSFDVFRVSYKNSLSEMNSAEEFYYSNSTDTKPVDILKLKHIAGVGSSPIVKYEGSGAYFLDKISDGVWRLEVMPDAVHIRDPFERTSPGKEVTRVQSNENFMRIQLQDFKNGFKIVPIDSGNTFRLKTQTDSFTIRPGTYLIIEPNVSRYATTDREFYASHSESDTMFLRHEPCKEVSAGKPFTISAHIVGLDSGEAILQISLISKKTPKGEIRIIPFVKKSSSEYIVQVPTNLVDTVGFLNYRIILQKGNEFAVFPGNHKENLLASNIYDNETYQTFVFPKNGMIEIFNSSFDKTATIYPAFRRGFHGGYVVNNDFGWRYFLQLSATDLSGDHTMGFVHCFGDKLKVRNSEFGLYDSLGIRARAFQTQPVKAKITLIDRNTFAFSTYVVLTNQFQDTRVSLNSFTPDSLLLLPRPYPGFLPLWFKASGLSSFNLSDMEKVQVTIGTGLTESELKKPYSLEVESIWLDRKNNF